MRWILVSIVIVSGCGAGAIGDCQNGEDCRPAAGSPHECEHYSCDDGTCVYGFDGGIVTCGNAMCGDPSDCHASTQNMSILCVSKQCVGTPQ